MGEDLFGYVDWFPSCNGCSFTVFCQKKCHEKKNGLSKKKDRIGGTNSFPFTLNVISEYFLPPTM